MSKFSRATPSTGTPWPTPRARVKASSGSCAHFTKAEGEGPNEIVQGKNMVAVASQPCGHYVSKLIVGKYNIGIIDQPKRRALSTEKAGASEYPKSSGLLNASPTFRFPQNFWKYNLSKKTADSSKNIPGNPYDVVSPALTYTEVAAMAVKASRRRKWQGEMVCNAKPPSRKAIKRLPTVRDDFPRFKAELQAVIDSPTTLGRTSPRNGRPPSRVFEACQFHTTIIRTQGRSNNGGCTHRRPLHIPGGYKRSRQASAFLHSWFHRLRGDTAHAMAPHRGTGAGQAIEMRISEQRTTFVLSREIISPPCWSSTTEDAAEKSCINGMNSTIRNSSDGPSKELEALEMLSVLPLGGWPTGMLQRGPDGGGGTSEDDRGVQ
ncbi:hypothetical protein C8F04DRAFT_1359790 [Mycena alexandri]|uniref:Uncharacterized protein n=1 Tax=Mycena alexandri TaxID=1745969 RepID=A0AAD6SRL6_9AGAR|nr:hypothetical protein C8F04DRAFT_1359790 [Mycena alexandri]